MDSVVSTSTIAFARMPSGALKYWNKSEDHYFGINEADDSANQYRVLKHREALVGSDNFILGMTGESKVLYIGHEADAHTKRSGELDFATGEIDMSEHGTIELMAASVGATAFLIKAHGDDDSDGGNDDASQENNMTRTNLLGALAGAED